MSCTIEELKAELTSPRFGGRWRRAWIFGIWFLGWPATILFVIGVAAHLLGNRRVIDHPLTMLAFGMWTGFLGVMLLWRPRTYAQYVRLQRCLRKLQTGHLVDETRLRRGIWSEAIVNVMGGLLGLFVGSCFLVAGVCQL